MRYNADATGEKYRDIAKAMGVQGVDAMTLEEARARRLRRSRAALQRRRHSRKPQGYRQGGGHRLPRAVRDGRRLPPRQPEGSHQRGHHRPLQRTSLICSFSVSLAAVGFAGCRYFFAAKAAVPRGGRRMGAGGRRVRGGGRNKSRHFSIVCLNMRGRGYWYL